MYETKPMVLAVVADAAASHAAMRAHRGGEDSVRTRAPRGPLLRLACGDGRLGAEVAMAILSNADGTPFAAIDPLIGPPNEHLCFIARVAPTVPPFKASKDPGSRRAEAPRLS
jgi:hypothetical protein